MRFLFKWPKDPLDRARPDLLGELTRTNPSRLYKKAPILLAIFSCILAFLGLQKWVHWKLNSVLDRAGRNPLGELCWANPSAKYTNSDIRYPISYWNVWNKIRSDFSFFSLFLNIPMQIKQYLLLVSECLNLKTEWKILCHVFKYTYSLTTIHITLNSLCLLAGIHFQILQCLHSSKIRSNIYVIVN